MKGRDMKGLTTNEWLVYDCECIVSAYEGEDPGNLQFDKDGRPEWDNVYHRPNMIVGCHVKFKNPNDTEPERRYVLFEDDYDETGACKRNCMEMLLNLQPAHG